MIPDLPKEPTEELSPAQRKAFNAMRKLLTDVSEADRRYNGLEESKKGKVISTDIARHLDTRYANSPPKGKGRDLTPGWDLAWRYAQYRLDYELRRRGKRKILRFMAGGWAAGKTFALNNEPSQPPDLIWDGTLNNPTWAAEMIDLALANGWKVEVVYVYRDLELALYGAIERERKVGRGVPIAKLPRNHRSVQKSILDLTTLYREDEDVSSIYLHNLGTEDVQAGTPVVQLIDLEVNGALHYLDRHEQYYAGAAQKIAKA